jgi:hypothetical protein
MVLGNDIYSYAEFRKATGLTKREADTWVQAGIIQAGPANGHRREYRFESVFEGIIAKQLADFSSRELLPQTMMELRNFLEAQGIFPARLAVSPEGPHRLIKVYNRRSREIMPGKGVRGVLVYIDWYDPESKKIGKAVYVVVDLTLIMIETMDAVRHLTTN